MSPGLSFCWAGHRERVGVGKGAFGAIVSDRSTHPRRDDEAGGAVPGPVAPHVERGARSTVWAHESATRARTVSSAGLRGDFPRVDWRLPVPPAAGRPGGNAGWLVHHDVGHYRRAWCPPGPGSIGGRTIVSRPPRESIQDRPALGITNGKPSHVACSGAVDLRIELAWERIGNPIPIGEVFE